MRGPQRLNKEFNVEFPGGQIAQQLKQCDNNKDEDTIYK